MSDYDDGYYNYDTDEWEWDDDDTEEIDYVLESYNRRCSSCGSRQLDDMGRCEVCHGDPYYEDEWYVDDTDHGDDYDGMFDSDVHDQRPLLTRVRQWIHARKMQIEYWIHVKLLRRSPADIIPF